MIKKYEKVLKEESDLWFLENQEKIKNVLDDKYSLKFHIMPRVGWVNDPNGLCQKNDLHHIFFQYCPYNVNGELKTWGHLTTKDFIEYNYEKIAIYPDKEIDKHGAYSGSCFIKDDVMNIFYTGNVKLFDRDDYDYIKSGRKSNTIRITSKDGIHFSEKELVLENKDYPKNISNHIRDPKIFEKDGIYYMVLGARDIYDKGCVVLYKSYDLEKWEYYTEITTKEPFGYMWECPDILEINGKWILFCCPQGVEQGRYRYANIYQAVAMFLNVDFENKVFEITDIKQLDYGFDFYAQQTYKDSQNRQIMIAWLGIPDADYTNPTPLWQHTLTMPRKLEIVDNRLLQVPLKEFEKLRKSENEYNFKDMKKFLLEDEIYELYVKFSKNENMNLQLKNDCILSYENSILKFDISEIGFGRKTREIKLKELKNIRVFMDTSCVEIYINDGEYTITSRLYSKENTNYIMYNGNENAKFIYYKLDSFIYNINDKDI